MRVKGVPVASFIMRIIVSFIMRIRPAAAASCSVSRIIQELQRFQQLVQQVEQQTPVQFVLHRKVSFVVRYRLTIHS